MFNVKSSRKIHFCLFRARIRKKIAQLSDYFDDYEAAKILPNYDYIHIVPQTAGTERI